MGQSKNFDLQLSEGVQYHEDKSTLQPYREIQGNPRKGIDSATESVAAVVSEVEDGYYDPLEAFVKLKELEGVVKAAKQQIQEQALSEAEKEPEKKFEKFGAEITKTSGKATYSFKHIPDWVEADKYKKSLEKQAKDALKAAQDGKDIVDENGEVVEPADVKYSADSLSIKIL